ncbi:hypothetical protein [Brevibacillus thermoruber]|jgi:hypothetical protein|uniref:hypothetical protein n=1 Tax=Brevibacillus thermoruber TaxID=33942 RepID=UPI000490E2BF|nr:hypothetical protein [Brevibacillus thermoruber]
MPCTHEFGILDEVDKRTVFSYEPHKYNCISVDDDLINDLLPHLSIMKTYFHKLERPEFGLARWGITIIPAESLTLFLDVVLSSKKSYELQELALKIVQAKEQGKWMIHFGI